MKFVHNKILLKGCLLWAVFLFFASLSSNAQQISYKAKSMKGKKGNIELIGNVVLTQLDYNIYCNRADFNPKDNSFDAYGNVHVKQKTGADITGDFLKYNGNKRMGKFRKNVKMKTEERTLTTDFLDFSTKDNSGYFYNGGQVVDSNSVLNSSRGYYYPNKKEYLFLDSVTVESDDYILYSDSVTYDLLHKIAYVKGPSEIVGDSSYLYCENGWYNTEEGTAQVSKNAWMKYKVQVLLGDSIFYDQDAGFGEGFGNISIVDSTRDICVNGHYAKYFQSPEYALITDSAEFIQKTGADSIYLHGDTLVSLYDTAGDYREIFAYNHVQIFKSDIQSISDSLKYSFFDSVVYLYDRPVIWVGRNQATAQQIELHTKNNVADYVVLIDDAFIAVQQSRPDLFNQIKGKKMTAFVRNNEIYRVEVKGMGKTIYFAKEEEGGDFYGINNVESTDITFLINKQLIQKIYFKTNPLGNLSPIELAEPQDYKLSGFEWLEPLRPLSRSDIFLWKEELK